MGEGRITPPRAVVEMMTTFGGEEGRAWLAEVPRLVDQAAAHWDLRLEAPFEGGNVAYVAPATRGDGLRCVLKVQLLTDETSEEGTALRVWDGDGAVRVLDEAPELGALLLERIEPGTALGDALPLPAQLEVLGTLLPRLWARCPPDGHAFLPVPAKLEEWLGELRGAVDDPRLGPVVHRVVAAAEALRQPDLRPTGHPAIVSRDVHPGNVLAATREPWLVIDPKPLVGEPAFDTGHLVRQLLLHDDLAHAAEVTAVLARALGLDVSRVRVWAALRSLVNARDELEVGGDDVAWDLLCAEAVLAAGTR